MPEVIDYRDADGYSPYQEFLQSVARSGNRKAAGNIDRATYALRQQGLALLNTSLMDNIEDGIFELRPGAYRILCFYDRPQDTFVFLCGFRKRTQRTPEREKARARTLVRRYLAG